MPPPAPVASAPHCKNPLMFVSNTEVPLQLRIGIFTELSILTPPTKVLVAVELVALINVVSINLFASNPLSERLADGQVDVAEPVFKNPAAVRTPLVVSSALLSK